MCDPVTIAGIALSAGSVAANSMAQSSVDSAREDAMNAERIRQQGYQQEANALNTKSQDKFSTFGADQTAKATQLGDYFAGQQATAAQGDATATAGMTMPQSGSNITIQEEAKQRGLAKDFTNQQGRALGNMRAFGDVLGADNLTLAQNASKIGQIGGFERGSSSVLPYELQDANSAGGGMKLFGDLLGAGGQLGLSAGLGKGTWLTPAELAAKKAQQASGMLGLSAPY